MPLQEPQKENLTPLQLRFATVFFRRIQNQEILALELKKNELLDQRNQLENELGESEPSPEQQEQFERYSIQLIILTNVLKKKAAKRELAGQGYNEPSKRLRRFR